jgi:agmatine deiminase
MHIFYNYKLLVALLLFPVLFAQTQEAWKTDPPGLKHWMNEEELARKDEIGKDFIASDAPSQPVVALSEFGRMKGVLIRYPFGISYALIKEMSMDAHVITIVSGQSQENTVRNNYAQNGVNLANCQFIHAPTNSYWTRDYGPWFIADGNEKISVINFPYNRPRPNDNAIPTHVANFLGMDIYNMNIIHTGGNYMTDGMGVAASTDLVWSENSSLTPEQISATMNEFLGTIIYHVVPDPNNTYIDHIDCWAKFLDVDKILIREVPSSHAQYAEIEAAAAYWEQQTSSYGSPYQVFRVYTPNNQPYTNSLILNHKVFVPITGSSWDNAALSVYQEAMPGYEILGFTGSWQSTDALHCRTKEIPDPGLLHIKHKPLWGQHPERQQYAISADIIAHSGSQLFPDSIYIHYSINNGRQYELAQMTNISGNTFTGFIPTAQTGDVVKYYLSAADLSGREETHPFIGEPDPHTFNIAETYVHQLQLNQNWTAISTYLLPFDGLEQIFDLILDDLIFVKNGDEIWWPGQGINTINTWDEQACLLVKMNQPAAIEIVALEKAAKNVNLSEGWNWLPVLSENEVNAERLFGKNISKVILLKEIAGIGVLWPEQNINTIGSLQPGKAYLVKTGEDFMITYQGDH